ncbi:UNVERIFIED_CONTAM: hypothetical protein NCL1_47056 [Trichonephila clavipes]
MRINCLSMEAERSKSDHTEFDKCMKRGAKDCGVEDSSIVKELLKVYDEICTYNTTMNAMYHKHKGCLFPKKDVLTSHCLENIARKISTIRFSGRENYKTEVMKVICNSVQDDR